MAAVAVEQPRLVLPPSPSTGSRGARVSWTPMSMVTPSPPTEGTPLLDGFASPRSPAAAVLAKARRKVTDRTKQKHMEDVIKELEGSATYTRGWKWFALAAILNHFLGGTITMHILEGWDLADALYFSVVVTTTVGYGDMAPKTAIGKVYVCYYVIAAVALISSMLAFFVGTLIDRQEEALMAIVTGEDDQPDDMEAGPMDGTEPPQDFALAVWLRRSPLSRFSDYAWMNNLTWLEDYTQVAYTGAVFVIVGIVGVWVFARFEGLTVLDSIYVTFISATTVGFGDIDPVKRTTKSIMTVWLILSTIVLAKLVGDQSEAYARSRQRAVARRLLSARMTTATLRRMDTDGDGAVDRGEFLASMLVQTGKVERADVDEIFRRFDELDRDNDGQIENEELD